MHEAAKIGALAIMVAVLDLPWLLIQGPWVQDIVRDIQADRSMNVRLWGAIPVYIAIGYILTQVHSAPRAFLLGMSTYAVYDFTQIVTFDKYPVGFAIADTLWGGVLAALTWWLASRINLVSPER
jgi:uncharacterized membrane protein